MAKCDICGKMNNTAVKYRYRGTKVTRKTLRTQKPNVRKIKVIENGTPKKIMVCTRCVRSNKVTRAI